MLKELDSYNWGQVFEFGKPNTVVPAAIISTRKFIREDVKKIIAISDGESDELNWIGVFELTDKRFAAVWAGHDYTGWD